MFRMYENLERQHLAVDRRERGAGFLVMSRLNYATVYGKWIGWIGKISRKCGEIGEFTRLDPNFTIAKATHTSLSLSLSQERFGLGGQCFTLKLDKKFLQLTQSWEHPKLEARRIFSGLAITKAAADHFIEPTIGFSYSIKWRK